MKSLQKLSFLLTVIAISPLCLANNFVVPMQLVSSDNSGQGIGTITFTDTRNGLLITPNLTHLQPGPHGFHIHENPSCANAGEAAGGHFDPQKTGKHLGPYEKGHLGDMPVLVVDKDGNATLPLLAPRLTTKEIEGHAIIIHEGGDNYSDQPKKLGGGGKRVACGVIYKE